MTNKEYDEFLANFLHKNGIKFCPFVLNSEQAIAFNKRCKQLNKQQWTRKK